MIKNSVVKVTKLAGKNLLRIAKEHRCKSILFSVKGGGCSGFNYKIEPTNEKAQEKDEVLEMEGYNLHICGKSLFYLLGTTIDWKKDIMGESFSFENPQAVANCGCGTSFSVND